MSFVPSLDQRDLLLAQNYLLKVRNGENNDQNLFDKNEKDAYNRIFAFISKKLNLTDLVTTFISEKGYDVGTILDSQKYYINPEEHIKGSNTSLKKEIQKTSSQINELILKLGVKELKSVNYDNEYTGMETKNIEPQIVSEKSTKKGYRYKVYSKEI
jgi:hypothetical protein